MSYVMAYSYVWFNLVIILLLIPRSSAETFYVIPTPNAPCPVESSNCLTFSQLHYHSISSNHNDYTSSIRLLLLVGNHSLDFEFRLSNLTYLLVSSLGSSNSILICSKKARLKFEHIRQLHIHDITFVGCIGNTITLTDQVEVINAKFDGQYRTGIGLQLSSVRNATILNSSFKDHTGAWVSKYTFILVPIPGSGDLIPINNEGSGGRERRSPSFDPTKTISSGRAINILKNSSVFFSHCSFTRNIAADQGGAIQVENSTMIMEYSTFEGNTAGTDGSQAYGPGGAIHAMSSRMMINSSNFTHNTAGTIGSALFAKLSDVLVNNCKFTDNTAISYGRGSTVRFTNSRGTITNSTFDKNSGGAVCIASSDITLKECHFINHTIIQSGTVDITSLSKVVISGCTFKDNEECSKPVGGTGRGGGGVRIDRSDVMITACEFSNNTATLGSGGAVHAKDSNITIVASIFVSNTATFDGGAVMLYYADSPNDNAISTVSKCVFANGNAGFTGGAVAMINDHTRLSSRFESTAFINNTAFFHGGAVFIYDGLKQFHYLRNTTFTQNIASAGAAFYVENVMLSSNGYLQIECNIAISGVVNAYQSTVSFSGTTVASKNSGSAIVAYSSNITFNDHSKLVKNSHSLHRSHSDCSENVNDIIISNYSSTDQKAGAITLFQCNLYFVGTAYLLQNEAENGGAISIAESKIYMHGEVHIAHNTALLSGGGISSFQSELTIYGTANITRNRAALKGGGIHIISSTVKVLNGPLHLTGNNAERGGGVCLEINAKLYIIKPETQRVRSSNQLVILSPTPNVMLEFRDNSADYGGAVYVTDDTNSGTCSANSMAVKSPTNECFFQVLALYTILYGESTTSVNLINTYFINNAARKAGENIFGGLLDRCSLSPFAEFFQKYPDLRNSSVSSTSYLLNITNLKKSHFSLQVSSNPVRVCFCKHGHPDCSYQPPTRYVSKGETFKISIVAVDQVNNTVPNATIRSSMLSEASLNEGQTVQFTQYECTDLVYNVFSPDDSARLQIFAEGPCKDFGISSSFIDVTFNECPIGFIEKNHRCDCDEQLYPKYVSNCSVDSATVQRNDNTWISYINSTESNSTFQFIRHPNCPYDYCHPSTNRVYIKLHIHNGADAQCAFNRTGILCGSCGENLSLSLGSSRCISCSNNWLALLILFAILGIVLVAFILVCNLTVAVGTISGLIFYANVLISNRAVFFPFEKPNFLFVFVAWLNLDFGIETCFYDGMDAYAKTWLQLAFPLYVMFLVILIVVVAEHSYRFSRLISNKNPIATLSTLILLSYTKFLRTIITVFTSTTLEYKGRVWLVDANVSYLLGKHIPLFITAIVILLVGILYTLLLLFGPWVMRCPNRKCIRHFRNHKLNSFMESYSAPYTPHHRYWTGLMVLARIILFVVSALNSSPSVSLLATIVVVASIIVLKQLSSTIYKKWPVDVLETAFLFNLLLFTGGTLYLYGNENRVRSQVVLAYISIGTAFVIFTLVVLYHSYKYLIVNCSVFKNLHSKWTKTNRRQQLKSWYKKVTPRKRRLFKTKDMENVNMYLKPPLNLIPHTPNTNEYKLAELQSPEPVLTPLDIEIPQGNVPLSKLLGHDQDGTIMNKKSEIARKVYPKCDSLRDRSDSIFSPVSNCTDISILP